MNLYKVYLTSDLSSWIFVGTETPSLIYTTYPNAYKVEKVDSLIILE